MGLVRNDWACNKDDAHEVDAFTAHSLCCLCGNQRIVLWASVIWRSKDHKLCSDCYEDKRGNPHRVGMPGQCAYRSVRDRKQWATAAQQATEEEVESWAHNLS